VEKKSIKSAVNYKNFLLLIDMDDLVSYAFFCKELHVSKVTLLLIHVQTLLCL